MALVDTISQIQNNLREGRIPNEATVSQSVVLPILQSLEWPVFDPSVVIPQYQVAEHPERRVVDYALLKPDEHLAIFVEVKKVGGIDATGERQLFEYAFHKGVPLAVLTDGQEWNFYLPLEQGGYQDRQVYKFDLLNRDIEECSYRLHRYLFKGAVLEGSALENMRADLRDAVRQGKIKETLPRAWESLISEADDSIVEALATKVAYLCGFEPSSETCANFLSDLIDSYGSVVDGPSEGPGPAQWPTPPSEVGFQLLGRRQTCSNATSVMRELFEALYEKDSTFPDRFAARKHGTKRRYLAKSKEELYPGRPDLSETHSIQLKFGWFLGTNYNKSSIEKIIRLACEVASLQFGENVIVNLG